MAYILGAFVVFAVMVGVLSLAVPGWVAWAAAWSVVLVSALTASGVGRRLGRAWAGGA